VADDRVTQLQRQGDAQMLKKDSHMKLQMKREALKKLNRKANDGQAGFDTGRTDEVWHGFATVGAFFWIFAGWTVSEIE
jgi:hypothetical protein